MHEVGRAEGCPAEHDDKERIDVRERAELVRELCELFDEQQHEVPKPPEEERPVRAVPDARERPNDEEVPDPARARHAVASERDVDVVAEPRAKRDVPAPPELRRAPRNIRIVEVLREAEAEHLSEADGHVGVAREIEINLERVGKRAEPRRRDGERHAYVKDVVRNLRDVIGDEHFLAEAVDETHHAVGKVRKVFLAVLDLLFDRIVAHDRASNELWEERDVKADVQHAPLCLGFAVINVEQVRQQLEREERDADRQRDVDDGRVRTEQESHLLRCKRQVLEDEQQTDMERNTRNQPSFSPHLVRTCRRADVQPDEPADDDGKHHQHDEHRLAPRVKQQARQEQEAVAEVPRREPWLIVDHEHERQKQEQEDR